MEESFETWNILQQDSQSPLKIILMSIIGRVGCLMKVNEMYKAIAMEVNEILITCELGLKKKFLVSGFPPVPILNMVSHPCLF